MDTGSLENRIAELQERIADRRRNLDSAQAGFIEATVEWYGPWIERTVETAVTENPEIVKRLSDSGQLRHIKAKIDKIQSRHVDRAREFLSDARIWPHRTEALKVARSPKIRPRDVELSPLFQATAELAKEVREFLRGRGFNVMVGTVDINWTEPMSSAYDDYYKLLRPFVDDCGELATATTDLKGAKARDIWNQT